MYHNQLSWCWWSVSCYGAVLESVSFLSPHSGKRKTMARVGALRYYPRTGTEEEHEGDSVHRASLPSLSSAHVGSER